MLQISVYKFVGVTGNNPGANARKLALISIESVLAPIVTVERSDGTVVISLQLLIEMGKSRDKAQSMHLLWGADRGKYTPLLDKPRNDFLEEYNSYPKTLSEKNSLLLHYKNYSTTYSGNIKYKNARSFDNDMAVEERNNKTPCGGIKGVGL